MDFDYNFNSFEPMLRSVGSDYKRAFEELFDMATHWEELGKSSFSGQVVVELDREKSLISGSVLNKKFSVHISLLTHNHLGFAEAVVTVPDAQNKARDIGRFWVARDGSIHSSDGEKVIPTLDDHFSYRTLIAVLRAVLAAPQQY